MKTNEKNSGFGNHIEFLKDGLDKATKNSEESLKEVMNNSANHIKTSTEASQKVVHAFMDQLESESPVIDTSYFKSLSNTLGKSVEHSEGILNAIAESHNKRVNLFVDLNKKYLDTLKEQGLSGDWNYENLNKMYAENLNSYVSYARDFYSSINTQVENMSEIFIKQMSSFINPAGLGKDTSSKTNKK